MALDAYSLYALIVLYAASIPVQGALLYTLLSARSDLDEATEDWKIAGDGLKAIANNFRDIKHIIKERNKNLTGIIEQYESK
jgi:hypothetical protein